MTKNEDGAPRRSRPVELSTAEFHALEELIVDLRIPLIISSTRTSDRIVDAINNPFH